MKRFASAAAVAVGLHLLLLSLDVDRRDPSSPRRLSTQAVTIDLNAASPRIEETRRLSPTPDPARLSPQADRQDRGLVSESPPDRSFEPKPAKAAESKAPPSKGRGKTAFKGPSQQRLEAAAPLAPDPLEQPDPGSSGGDSLPEAEDGRWPAQAAGGQTDAGVVPSMASGPAATAPVLQEATPAYDQIPPPEYPGRARQLGFEGTVVLDVRVNPSGGVDDVKIAASSGYSLLDQSALRSVKTWRFKPARRGDQPVAAWVQVPVRYTLKPPGSRMP